MTPRFLQLLLRLGASFRSLGDRAGGHLQDRERERRERERRGRGRERDEEGAVEEEKNGLKD